MGKPAVSGRLLRYVLMGVGALVAVGTAVQDALSAHPELTWKALLFAAGSGLVTYAKRFFADFPWEELPAEVKNWMRFRDTPVASIQQQAEQFLAPVVPFKPVTGLGEGQEEPCPTTPENEPTND